ncbi:peptidoglycan recognition protein, partial [Streptomyces daliensis]|nr:peptidoglycan recognition protein [Streptomyces daliensis]
MAPKKVEPFSLVGVVWDDAATDLHGDIQVRTRAEASGRWTDWRDLEAHGDGPEAPEAPEAGTPGGGPLLGRPLPGGPLSAPLWVGASDGVEVRVLPEAAAGQGDPDPESGLPEGLRLELVDPGPKPPDTSQGRTAHKGSGKGGRAETAGKGRAASQPRIVERQEWGADENLREKGFSYTDTVKTAFVHHTAMSNAYSCSQVPSIIRGIYRYHVKSSKWRDIGYNFLVDKCGTVYEGRAGGVAKPVMGAHTYGFNSNSTGIAVIGSFDKSPPPEPAVDGVAQVAAWKLGLHGANPLGTTVMTSGGGTKHKKGTKVTFNAIAGHRDGFVTSCPGAQL